MSEVNSWSTTAASNNSTSPNGFPENMAFAGVNDSAREVMAAIKRWRDDTNGTLTAGGSSGAYTLAPNRTISAYATGLEFVFKANHTYTGGSPTMNVSSLGAKALNDHTGAGIDLISGRYYRATYITSAFVVMDYFADIAANQEWAAAQYYSTTSKTASTISVDCLSEPVTKWTLSASGTLNDFTSKTEGARGVIIVVQGGAGSYTITPNANIKGTLPTLSTAVGAVDELYWSCPTGSDVSIVGYSLNVLA